MLNHPYLKTKISDFSPKIESNFEKPERNISPEIPAVELKMLGSTQNGQSRVKNEFEFLQHIGTGAYGDVIKVTLLVCSPFWSSLKFIQLCL